MTFIKAEWFRHSKIRAYPFFMLALIMISLAINLYLRLITPYHDFDINLLNGTKIIISLFLMGLTIAFPIITSAFSNKSRFIKEQLVTSQINFKQAYLCDLIIASIYSMVAFVLFIGFSFIFGRTLLGPSLSPLTFGPENISVWQVYLAILVAIVTLLVQAISIHKIIKNSILSTGLFIGISYVLAIILLQTRFFSQTAAYLSLLFPMCNMNYWVGGHISFLSFISLNFVLILAHVGIVLTYNKFKTGLTSH
ncbi:MULTISPECIES: hypothetical protein [Aerococcus]|uniref:Uncharacterized protein n=4 Tax=Aerococcus TaxID=1375 RepID=A0A178HFR7_9LACT|nr:MULTISPECIES: hypothetical protein [Aerococcus]MCY3025536.1 hypothetical protein [Aerococcus loyolae]MCY3026518.1 hypothetical protein [Aerococcus loyolae]MCY3028374.1 hypothetical protein [Aerococcus loyolae]MCY3063865.1 hypothetical protein [Aerococcus mictus]MDK6231210.1 hypothetical protein [Aerococcus urinae]